MIVKKGGLPGDLKTLKLFIDGHDVTQIMSHVEVFLDVLTPNWSCKVYMNDANNLIMTLPIKQGSKISIIAETDLLSVMDGKKTFNFIVYQITDKNFNNFAHQTYTIHGAPEAWIRNMDARVTRSYSYMSPVMIAQAVATEYLRAPITSAHPANNVVSTSPSNLSPFNLIGQMCKQALIGNRSDFIFFQTDNTQYTMKSIEMMYSTEHSGFTFKMKPANIRDSQGNTREDYCQCFSSYYLDHYDGASNKSGGLYSSTAATYDLVSQNWSGKDGTFGFGSMLSKIKKVWESGGIFDKPSSNITFNPTHPGMSDRGPTALDFAKEWSPSRKSSLLRLEQDNLIIQVPCGINGWKGLGKSCRVELPSQQQVKKIDYDEQFSGLYLITAMCFLLSKHAAFTNYHLSKINITKEFGKFSF